MHPSFVTQLIHLCEHDVREYCLNNWIFENGEDPKEPVALESNMKEEVEPNLVREMIVIRICIMFLSRNIMAQKTTVSLGI